MLRPPAMDGAEHFNYVSLWTTPDALLEELAPGDLVVFDRQHYRVCSKFIAPIPYAYAAALQHWAVYVAHGNVAHFSDPSVKDSRPSSFVNLAEAYANAEVASVKRRSTRC